MSFFKGKEPGSALSPALSTGQKLHLAENKEQKFLFIFLKLPKLSSVLFRNQTENLYIHISDSIFARTLRALAQPETSVHIFKCMFAR